MIPSLIAFDLDGTLASSKQAIQKPIPELLFKLLERTSIALISGGTLEQLTSQVVAHLPSGSLLEHFYILPTSGAALYSYTGEGFGNIYEESLSKEDSDHIEREIHKAIATTSCVDSSTVLYGNQIEKRGAQVTFSALGQQAPIEAKKLWDPTHEKRQALISVLMQELPDFDSKEGGMTSLDITKKGVNKAFGMRKLSEYLDIPISSMLYVGDALYPGGNDAVVKETGIKTHSVENPEATASFLEELLRDFS
jgi:phosphomannomutase